MHEYIEIQFRRRGKPFRVKRQIAGGFEFEEADPPTRTIDIGVVAFGDGTKYRLNRIRQVKGWNGQEFRLRVSVEDGSLVLRGDDEFSLPEGWYHVTANVSDAKAKKVPPRVEVVHDGHGTVVIELETDARAIDVSLNEADPQVLRVLGASTIDGQPGLAWIVDKDIRANRRACALNLLASLRVTPRVSAPLLSEVTCFFIARDERSYAQVTPEFFAQVSALSEGHDKFYPEGPPRAPIHRDLIAAIGGFEKAAEGLFDTAHLLSFRAEGSPSLQTVIATPSAAFGHMFADIDLDLGNPLQDIAGFVVHMGELLTGQPTNHLDLRKKLGTGKAKPYLYYTVKSPS